MNPIQRAWAYVSRKRLRSFILFLILLVLLAGISACLTLMTSVSRHRGAVSAIALSSGSIVVTGVASTMIASSAAARRSVATRSDEASYPEFDAASTVASERL